MMNVRNEYGRALFLLAKEEGAIEKIKCDTQTAADVLKNNPRYITLLDTPALSKEERLALADEAFGALHPTLKNLIKILTEKRLVYSFGDVCSTYLDMYNEEMGIEEVEAITAIPMSDAQKENMRAKLEAHTGKKIIITNTVDPTILGGVKIRYSGRQVDGSVKARLDAFADSIKNIVI